MESTGQYNILSTFCNITLILWEDVFSEESFFETVESECNVKIFSNNYLLQIEVIDIL